MSIKIVELSLKIAKELKELIFGKKIYLLKQIFNFYIKKEKYLLMWNDEELGPISYREYEEKYRNYEGYYITTYNIF